MPERIQRQRTRGWRMPQGAVYVGRPTVWGNIWRPEDAYYPLRWSKQEQAAWAVQQFERDAQQRQFIHYDLSNANAVPLKDLPARLGGLDLVCWCPLDQPCHADILLKLANEGAEPGCRCGRHGQSATYHEQGCPVWVSWVAAQKAANEGAERA